MDINRVRLGRWGVFRGMKRRLINWIMSMGDGLGLILERFCIFGDILLFMGNVHMASLIKTPVSKEWFYRLWA